MFALAQFTIYNSQVMKSAHMPGNRWMDKENVIYINNGLLFNHKEKRNYGICRKMDEIGEYHAEISQSQKSKRRMISLISGWWHIMGGEKGARMEEGGTE